jgi:hypothetical protein
MEKSYRLFILMIFDTKNIPVQDLILNWNKEDSYEGDLLPFDLFYTCRKCFPGSSGSFFDWKEAEKAGRWALNQISRNKKVLSSDDGGDSFDLYAAPEPTFTFMKWILDFFGWELYHEVDTEEATSWIND